MYLPLRWYKDMGSITLWECSHFASSPESVGKINFLGPWVNLTQCLQFITSVRQRSRGNYGKETLFKSLSTLLSKQTPGQSVCQNWSQNQNGFGPIIWIWLSEPPSVLCCCSLYWGPFQMAWCLPCWYPHSRYIKEHLPAYWVIGWLSGGLWWWILYMLLEGTAEYLTPLQQTQKQTFVQIN